MIALQGRVLTDDPEAAVSLALIPLILGAVVSSVMSGFLSDFLGGRRKIIVYWSGAFMAVACFFLAFARTFPLLLVRLCNCAT